MALTIGLDHVGIVVRHLEEARRFAEALGFTLTRRAAHESGDAGAGSAQHSIMLERGYVEIQELADLNGSHPVAAAARARFGLHILAFGVADAEAARREAVARGLDVGPVLHWSRAIDEGTLTGSARFAFFVAPYRAEQAGFLCWVEHRTPELLRAPALLRHANGARALDGVIIAVDDDATDLVALYRGLGVEAIEIMDRRDLPAPIARSRWPAPRWAAALRIACDDPAALASGRAAYAWGAALVIDTMAALGCWIVAQPMRR